MNTEPLTPEHLTELIRLLTESRNIPGGVILPREGVNLLLSRIEELEAARPKQISPKEGTA